MEPGVLYYSFMAYLHLIKIKSSVFISTSSLVLGFTVALLFQLSASGPLVCSGVSNALDVALLLRLSASQSLICSGVSDALDVSMHFAIGVFFPKPDFFGVAFLDSL